MTNAELMQREWTLYGDQLEFLESRDRVTNDRLREVMDAKDALEKRKKNSRPGERWLGDLTMEGCRRNAEIKSVILKLQKRLITV